MGRKRWSPDVRLTEPLRPFRDPTAGTQLNHAWQHGNWTGLPTSQTKRNFFSNPRRSILDAKFASSHQPPHRELAVIFQRRAITKNADKLLNICIGYRTRCDKYFRRMSCFRWRVVQRKKIIKCVTVNMDREKKSGRRQLFKYWLGD